MSRPIPSASFRSQISAKAIYAIIVAMLVAIAIAVGVLFWSVRQSNDVSVERQVQISKHAIKNIAQELAEEVSITAIWDFGVIELQKPSPNWQEFDSNMGGWLNQFFGHDQVYVLNSQSQPVYAMVDGSRAPLAKFNELPSSIRHLVEAVREEDPSRSRVYSRTQQTPDGRPPAIARAPYYADVMGLSGRPAAVAAMKIVPHTNLVTQQPGTEFILVSIRLIDDDFIKELATQNLIEGLRFSSTPAATAGEEILPLNSDNGEHVGYFMWRPELPGTRIIATLGPAIALVCILVTAGMALLVRSLRRSIRHMDTMFAELRASEARAQHLAFHDVLTGLPNRALFEEKLDQGLVRTRRGEKLAILMLDLDRFKQVNDTLGHHAGDSVVREFARRLSNLLRPVDTVARLGGDEFAIVQVGIGSKADAEALCERVLNAVREPFNVLGQQAFLGVSIGVALAPEAGSDHLDLLRKADIALYHAKDEGRDCFRFFTASMDETVKLRGAIEEELRAALDRGGELRVFYQPQVAGFGSPVIGLEALVRWEHPSRGLISPDQFIPLAEESGLIVRLGEWVLRHACATSRRWPDLFVAVNLSPVQFRSPGFAERVMEIVREAGADPYKIELEVTEGLLLADDGFVQDALQKLRRAGFKIALDDFGTGYSSLSYLQQFKVDKIKIDQSFVQNLGQEANSATILSSIISLGQGMGLTVAAEGVETEDQKEFLAGMGCDELQGYLFAHAVPEEQLGRLLQKHSHEAA